MQDFFKETSLREKLQEQCDDLSQEVDRLHITNTKLRKQLVDAQSAVTEKDKEIAGAGTDATGWNENKHNTIVNGMEKKFALETKLLEEQKQKLKEEKRVAQEKEAAESAKAAELQQVLDDLNVELERQGREWDAEKLQLAEQGAKIELLTQEISALKEERDALSAELASANSNVESLQTKLITLEESRSNELHQRDERIDNLVKTVEALHSDVTAAEQRCNDVSTEAKQSVALSASEAAKRAEELQAKITSVQQQHSDELRQKDENIALHVQTEKELQEDLAKLQERADRITADLESERIAHAENLRAKIAEIQESSRSALEAREADISSHLKSIEDLQSQISTLQQGETDGVQVSQELTKKIKELETAHEEAIRLKTEQNEELVRQLEVIDNQLSSDAAEMKQLKEEADSLRKTVEVVEQAAKQDSDQHVIALDRVQEELAEARKKADSYKADLDTAQDRHRQDLRVLGEDHDAEIESLRADLEGDAKRRLDKLQAEYDALVAEKNLALEVHENSLADRTKELEEAKKEIGTLKESSRFASQGLDDAIAKQKQVSEENAALAKAHFKVQKQVADLEIQIGGLTQENSSIAELKARVNALTEDKQAVEESLAASDKSFSDLTAKFDALAAEQQSLEDQQSKAKEALAKTQDELEAANQNRHGLEDARSGLQKIVEDLTARYDSLVHEKSALEVSHARTVNALRQDSENATNQTLNELQLRYNTLLEENARSRNAHTGELGNLQAQIDSLVTQLADAKNELKDTTTAQKTAEDAQAEALEKALKLQRQDMEQKYAALLEEVQADCNKLEQEIGTAINERESALSELEALKAGMQAEIDSLKYELLEKEELDSAGLVEVSKKYETLLVEQSAADQESHQAAINKLAQTLKDEFERAMQDAHIELEDLKTQLASKEKSDAAGLDEVKEQYESLLAEQSAADKRDHEATLALLKESADTDLAEIKDKYRAILAERELLKDELELAKETRIEAAELRRKLENETQSGQANLHEMTRKYDELLADKIAADETHDKALSSLKNSLDSDREHCIAELESQNSLLQDRLANIDEDHKQTLARLEQELMTDQSSNADALLQQLELAQKEHANSTEQMVEAHENAISELMIDMQNSATDAVQQLQKRYDALEAHLEAVNIQHKSERDTVQCEITEQRDLLAESRARLDRAVYDLEAATMDVERLQNTVAVIEAERDQAYKAATEAEDHIERFKGEVVRKHLARIEPLQKENTALLDKIDRLQDMLAAGDRIARAAASLGEKREMTTLAEEPEEGGGSVALARDAPRAAPHLNGAAKDVVGTVSLSNVQQLSMIKAHKLMEAQQLAAMQETLSQLNALNNDAIAESVKTAQRLEERE
jgi:chromosome segregation ATPase